MIAAIVQARMSSSRFPGKVLEPILGQPMLRRQLERVSFASQVDQVVVATSDQGSDDPIAAAVEAAGVDCFRGSLDDVLDRVYQAALEVGAEHVVRLTGDCPLTDAAIVDTVVAEHLRMGNDYTSNTVSLSFPDGLDVEVVSLASLRLAWQLADDAEEREHVTPYLYRNPEDFKLGQVLNETDLSSLRWTVDHPVDLEFVRQVFAALYPSRANFGMKDILQLLQDNPGLAEINGAVNPTQNLGTNRSNPMTNGSAV